MKKSHIVIRQHSLRVLPILALALAPLTGHTPIAGNTSMANDAPVVQLVQHRQLEGEELIRHLAWAAQEKFNLKVHQWLPGRVGVHGDGRDSMHYHKFPSGIGRAFDAIGSPTNMRHFARWVRLNHPNVTEGIHKPNLSIDNGRRVPSSFWGSKVWNEHANHVHIAV